MLREENIRLVGYGYQVDQQKGRLEELREKLKAGEELELPKPREFKEKSFEQLQMEAVMENYSITSDSGFVEMPSPVILPKLELDDKVGVKMYTDTKIQGTVQEYLLAGVEGEDNGACNGDSGGGVFYKTKAGKWRYAGVINMKSPAGCGSDVYDLGGINFFDSNTATLIMKKESTAPAELSESSLVEEGVVE